MIAGAKTCFWVLLLGSQLVFGSQDINKSLVGVRSVEIRVDKLAFDVRGHGLGQDLVEDTIKKVLQDGGIEIAKDGQGDAILELKINTFWDKRALLYAFSVRSQVIRRVRLSESLGATEAVTWQSSEPTGIIGQNRLKLVSTAVAAVTREFVIDCLKSNQKADANTSAQIKNIRSDLI